MVHFCLRTPSIKSTVDPTLDTVLGKHRCKSGSIFFHDGQRWVLSDLDSLLHCRVKRILENNTCEESGQGKHVEEKQGEHRQSQGGHVTREPELKTSFNELLMKVRGIEGMTMAKGERGMRGETGMRGVQGEKGDKGEMGPRGHRGIQGEKGEKGLDGLPGLQGPTGPMGLPGMDGLPGLQGPTGPMGLPGMDGLHGLQGPTGPMGLPGMDGLPGLQGPTGPMGLPSVDGLPGLQGPTGSMGLPGLQGPTGSKGDSGALGPTGPTGPQPFIGDSEYKTTSIGINTSTIGKSSVYIGYDCGNKENSDENVYIGYQAGTIQSAGLNTIVGSEAGKYCSGSRNTYIGNNVCGGADSSASYNLFAGSEAGFNNTSGFGNVFLGAVSGASNTEGCWNIFLGQSAGHSNTVGTNNIFIGANAGLTNISGSSCICIGDGADTSSDVPMNQLVFGQGVVSYGDNTLTFPNNLRSFPHGTEVNFSTSNGGCLYPVSSSIRWKANVQDIADTIDTSNIYNLRPVTFNPAPGHGNEEELHIGLIAEEVERYFPVIVPKDTLNRPSSVRYSLLPVLMLNELKKLSQEVKNLNDKINKQ